MNRMQERIDALKVMAVTSGATGISLADAEMILKCLSWAVAIGYALWKWRTDVLRNRRNQQPEKEE